MAKVVVIEQQSILDIAIQEYGSVEGIVSLMNDNPDLGLNFNYNLLPGNEVNIETAADNVDTVDYFRRKQLRISTKGVIATGDFDGNDFDENDFYT